MLLATICLFNMLKLLQLDYFKRRKKIGRKSLKKVEIEGMRLTNAGRHPPEVEWRKILLPDLHSDRNIFTGKTKTTRTEVIQAEKGEKRI